MPHPLARPFALSVTCDKADNSARQTPHRPLNSQLRWPGWGAVLPALDRPRTHHLATSERIEPRRLWIRCNHAQDDHSVRVHNTSHRACAGLILGADRPPGADSGVSLNRRPAGDQRGQSLTTVSSTISASPSTRAVTGRPPGTIREDLRARVAVHPE